MPAGTTDWKGEVCTLEFGSCQETLCSTSHGEFVTAKSTGKYKKLVKGIVFAHRDSCRACKEICRVLLDIALQRECLLLHGIVIHPYFPLQFLSTKNTGQIAPWQFLLNACAASRESPCSHKELIGFLPRQACYRPRLLF